MRIISSSFTQQFANHLTQSNEERSGKKLTNRKKPDQFDWRNRNLADWNTNTFLSFVADKTKEMYGVDYAPGGHGSKSQRWARERGMLKQAQGRYGNAVLKRFIEICWRNYRTSQPDKFPYPTWTFMYSYMDRYFAQAQAEVAREQKRQEAKEVDYAELAEWL